MIFSHWEREKNNGAHIGPIGGNAADPHPATRRTIACELSLLQSHRMSGDISTTNDLALSFPNTPVEARNYQEPGTNPAVFVGVILAVVLLLILTLITYGIAL